MLESLSQKMLGLVCASLFRSVATRRNLTDRNITELILELDSVHNHQKTKTFLLRWQYHRWHFWHKLHTVDWQYKLSTYRTCNPQVYGSSQWVTTYRGTPTSLKTLGHGVFLCCSFFLKLYSCWWKRQIDTSTSTWMHWMKDSPHCQTWQFR
jgi:hypothetical protein